MLKKIKTNSFPVVGIGASAGCLDAVTGLLTNSPVNTGMAFVYVQQLSAHRPSAITQVEIELQLRLGSAGVRMHTYNTAMLLTREFLTFGIDKMPDMFTAFRWQAQRINAIQVALKVKWLMGAAYFKRLLIDYDVCSNYGNWAYIAGVGNNPRQDRYFNIN